MGLLVEKIKDCVAAALYLAHESAG